MGNKNNIFKTIVLIWIATCRGELIVFIFGLFTTLTCLAIAIKLMQWNLWVAYGLSFAILWTRYLSKWMESSYKNRKTKCKEENK